MDRDNLDVTKLQHLVEVEEIYIPTVCAKCGGKMVYSGLGEYTCEKCGNKDYDDYGRVRNYLERFPGARILQVEKGTGVSRHKITEMIRRGEFTIN